MTSRAISRRRVFRELLSSDCSHLSASVFDPLSARLAESVGYRVGLMAGSTVAAAVLGAPDMHLHTATEYAEQARRVARACSLCLLVDADSGYGNALNVMRTVEELEHAGVAAISIEDVAQPVAFGQPVDEIRLLSVEEGVGKLRAALTARSDPELVIAARTPALRVGGIGDALTRVKAYSETGVDMVFIAGGLTGLGELEAVASATSLPLIIGSRFGNVTRKQMASNGVRVINPGHASLAAAVFALRQLYAELMEHGGRPPGGATSVSLASQDEMDELLGSARYRRWAEDFLR